VRGASFAAASASLAFACSSLDPHTGPAQASTCVNADSDPTTTVNFRTDIRPLMNRGPYSPSGAGCSTCHYPTGTQKLGIIQSGLDLSTLGRLRKGGKTTSDYIIDTDEPCGSGLVMKLMGTDPLAPTRMPKLAAPWKPSEIQLVIDWMIEGANGSDDE
jgi:hypothetical protein